MDRSHLLFTAIAYSTLFTVSPAIKLPYDPFNWFSLPNTSELVSRNGYPVETHLVTTEDGYILTVFRIPHGIHNSTKTGKPLILQHGFLCSSDCWVFSTPEKGFGYVLAEAGFDVWLPNSRGSTYSRAHRTLSPSKAKYWQFSFHELGIYDSPAVIDYILNRTGYDKVTYIGHSQGTTQFFIMASMRPEYGDKVKVMSGLAPIAYLDHTKGVVKGLSRISYALIFVMKVFRINHMLEHPFLIQLANDLLCRSSSPVREICTDVISGISGFDGPQYNSTLLKIAGDYCPTGASSKQLEHFAQLTTNKGKFTMFDYGERENMIRYNSSSPPEYPLDKIQTPIILHHGVHDFLASVPEVIRLRSALPNVKGRYQVEQFNHLDFMWAVDVKEILYDEVINLINNFDVGDNGVYLI